MVDEAILWPSKNTSLGINESNTSITSKFESIEGRVEIRHYPFSAVEYIGSKPIASLNECCIAQPNSYCAKQISILVKYTSSITHGGHLEVFVYCYKRSEIVYLPCLICLRKVHQVTAR